MARVGSIAGRVLVFLALASGALLFGAGDRAVQGGLLAALALGMAAAPPREVGRLGWIFAAALAFVALKEFLPAGWGGLPEWRERLAGDYRLAFPPTRSPEPGRAADALVAGAAAAAFFFWARRLTGDPGGRIGLAWAALGAGLAVALVSVLMPQEPEKGIYGVRAVQGWTGFGPFPNRNHTANFLAMAALAGCGVLARSVARRRWGSVAASGVALVAVAGALLESRSRGGALALLAGLLCFGALALAKARGGKAWALAASSAAVAGTLFLVFGGELLGRFGSETAGAVSTRTRLALWGDVAAMWRDAPLLGHGFGVFAGVYPMYQRVELESQIVLHPESSWLEWLAEGGILWTGALAAGLALALAVAARDLLARKQGFWVRAGALAAVVALASHCLIDVPGQRWPNVAMGLALLAVALSPGRRNDMPPARAHPAWAAVPAAAAIFWLWPLSGGGASWSAGSLGRIEGLLRSSPGRVRYGELAAALRGFPLHAGLHHEVGLRLLPFPKRAAAAAGHFRVADRLVPSSWAMPAMQGRACARYAPAYALHFWSLAVDRAGRRAEDVYLMAAKETAALPGAEEHWARYAALRPELLLTRALNLGSETAAEEYARWMRGRAGADGLEEFEVRNLYALMERHGTAGDLAAWRRAHAEFEPRDFRVWARLYHRWENDREAWDLLAKWIREPLPPEADPASAPQARKRWLLDPSDYLSAQQTVAALLAGGDEAAAREVLETVLSREDAPAWFLRRGAYGRAREGRFREAVELILREPPLPPG